MATQKVTKKGALQVSQTMDRLASLFQDNHETLGVSRHVAEDFALRLDRVSDLVETEAGIKRAEWAPHSLSTQPSLPETDGFDPLEIAKTEPGALETDPDEPYVRDNFTEQESNELSDKQITGQLPYADVLPEQDMLGKLASSGLYRVGGSDGASKMEGILRRMKVEEAVSADAKEVAKFHKCTEKEVKAVWDKLVKEGIIKKKGDEYVRTSK